MREILFRGKRIDSGEWVYGIPWIFSKPVEKAIIVYAMGLVGEDDDVSRYCESYEVDPETVGQYTGLTDKNGKRIFEGDIIQKVDGFVFGSQYKAVVKMGNEKDGTYMGCYFAESSLIEIDAYDFGYCEVIGNATDNPELLEVEE